MKVLRRSVLLAAAAVMLLAVGVWGQDSLNVSFAGYCYNFWDSVTDIEADSPYVYVGCMASGIHVVDASDPENPVEVSNFFLPCIEPEYIVAFNDYLFVNDDYDFGIAILDISVPENINLLTVIPASSGAMAIENEVLFLADYWNDVIVSYDISDIYSVAELDRWYMYTGSAKGIVIEDNVAYVSNRANRIYSLDISDPRSITVIDSLELDDAIPKDIQDGYLYLIDEPMFIYESSSFDIVDVSDPANLNLAYTTQLTYGNDVAVRGDFAYVTDNEDDGEVYNISDPAPTFLVANVGEMTGPVEIAGSVLYSWYYSGLQLFDISSTPVISPGANVSETAHLLRVYVEDDKAYLTDEEYGLRIVDISDPSSPEEIGCLEIDLTDKRRTGIAKKDEMLFVACDDIGLRGINVNFPWSPSYSYTFSSPDMSACDVFIKGDIMHVAWGNKYKIHDVSSLYYPPTLSILNVNTTTVCANDTLAVIGGDQKLRLVDTRNPSSPQLGDSIEISSEALKIRMFSDRLFVQEDIMVSIYQFSGYNEIDYIGHIFGNPTDFEVDGYYVLTVQNSSGQATFRVYDASNLEDVNWVGRYNISNSNGLDVLNQKAFISSNGNFSIYDYSESVRVIPNLDNNSLHAFSLSPIYPNPFNNSMTVEYQVAKAGEVRLAVYDVLGRTVGVIQNGYVVPGQYSNQWDAGNVATGVYYIQLEQGELKQVSKAVLIK